MFTLPTLDYSYDALSPAISAEIMELHHSKHHQAYVDKLNTALEALEAWQGRSIEDILTHLQDLPENVQAAIRNNGGGHYNHSLFWKSLTPGGSPIENTPLEAALVQKYGSIDAFKEQFTQAALGVFGSGWAWLLPDLSITTTPNQDSPLSLSGIAPLLGLDVWEHAYYLDYKNRRPEYITAWWDTVNWDIVHERTVAQ